MKHHYFILINNMRRNIITKAFVTALLAASATTLHAVPAYPKPVKVTQPDGRTVTICLKGDERMNWAETTDGYTLLRDDKGYWAFATTNKKGNLIASNLRYEGSSAVARTQGIQPRLRFSASQVRKAMKKTAQQDLMIDGTFPATGKRKLLVLLVNYSDTRTTYTREDFYRMMNQKNYGGVGSFRDYYLEQSYGKLDIDVTVTDWIQLPKPKGTYGSEGAAYMIYDALDQVADTIDLSQFDNDGDGILDGLAVIHQGPGREASADASDIWSHSSVVYGMKFNGINVRRYTIEPEILASINSMSTIGVICHEFGHALGAPDFYDTDYEESGGEFCGTGIWDLLGSGAWGGDYNSGNRPTGINAWQKWVWGWLEPTTLENDTTVAGMPSADQQPVAYRMETGTPGEYFIMENRQTTTSPFDRALYGHGLIVYHVNENIIREKLATNDINATYPQGIYTVCSDAFVEPDSNPKSFGDINSEGCPFPGEYGHTEFTDSTAPSAKSLDGRYSYRALHNITDQNGKVGFRFTHYAEPPKPMGLTATAHNGTVTLAWSMDENSKQLVDHYNIYRNNVLVDTASDTTYTDLQPDGNDVISYQVDAAYQDGRLSHPSSAEIRVPANKVTAMEAAVDGKNVTLSWTVDNTLTRADLYGGRIVTADLYGDEVEYANCYTPADLNTYVGSKITKMTFLPAQGPSDISVKFHVWEGDANGNNMTLVSERNVKEFGNGQPRELKLTTPVTIKADKTYWIAVACTSNNGVVSAPFEQNNLAKGRGNCVLKDGKFVEYGETTGNFYVSATLTLPTAEAENVYDTERNPTFDAANDLFFPLAYSIYCDGELAGRTTARHKTFKQVADGRHLYTVSSYYNGDNESVGISQTVTVGTTGIMSMEATEPVITTGHGWLSIAGYQGHVTLSHADGKARTLSLCGDRVTLRLTPGLYIVKAGDKVTKVIVK